MSRFVGLVYGITWLECSVCFFLAMQPAVRGPASRSGVKVQAIFTKSKASTKTAYVCLDCGYLYDGATPFEDLKSYACPVCGAPKRR